MLKHGATLPILAVLMIAGATGAANAQNCKDAQTQADMTECAGKAYEEADTKLNETYEKVTSRLTDLPEIKTSLTNAQRAWISFRDAECAFSNAQAGGGTLHGTLINQCLTDMTNQRIEALEGYLQCEEGDISCPVPRD
ncbi:lysozyme inhibitor LprI family protein [Tianweitania sp. BSSL-BM11]|uniref:Lysozyme inhibitor LprI family protein n=1 Tax=Tianweitania aestuarii TaxID=2814886 RepID=A0ABS5S000_9HYPH|nr:lysozyme inhibitor LprI family protein [Tianweitania aestuarii]MBS9722608.1 lysozyme inhibitor LprI family protein [Tianweitania aestuarii]